MGIDPVKPRAVFLDRDGVLNRAIVRAGKPYPPASVDELEILPGAAGALSRLKAAGYALVVVTNQPDIARGTTTREAVDAIHARMAATLPIDEFRVCPHDDRDACAMPEAAPGPAGRSADHRRRRQRDGGGPLAGHRGRPGGRLPRDNSDRLRLR